jgi:pimeloyl-ACP methyl ester carboxylesterase
MTLKIFSYQSAKIFYRVAGNGKPILLIHGFGEDGNVWKHQVDFLQQHYQLIIPDLPGSGQSEMIEDMSIEGMAEAIKELIDNELAHIAEKVVLIGHSMGGYITLAFAEKYPGLLTSFGLFHSSAFSDNDEKKATRLKAIDFIKTNGSYEFLKTSTPGLFTTGYIEQHKATVDELINAGQSFLPKALVAYYKAMIVRKDRIEVLKQFPHPILFICGLHDKAIPFQQSMQQVSVPVQSHIHILRNSAHMGMWEESTKSNEVLFGFLSNL